MTRKRLPRAVTGTAHSEQAEGNSPSAKGTPVETPQGQHIAQVRAPAYDFQSFEAKWRARWEEQKLYQVDLHRAQRPYYNLMMFPYPSAEGLRHY